MSVPNTRGSSAKGRSSETAAVVQDLVEGVIALSEATRALAVGEHMEPEALHELRLRSDAVAGLVALVEAATCDGIAFEGEPKAPLPTTEIVESLDDLFGPGI